MFIQKCYLVVSEITVPTLKICIDNGVVSLENWTVQLQCIVHLDCTIKSEIRLWTGGYGQVFENIFLHNFLWASYCSFPVWVRKENTFFSMYNNDSLTEYMSLYQRVNSVNMLIHHNLLFIDYMINDHILCRVHKKNKEKLNHKLLI